MTRSSRDVVFVDGVRIPFGKAGPKAMYVETRADDLVVRCIRELVRRNPGLPPERIDEVAIAATTQIGDQGQEGVVAQAQDVDLCVLLGAGWPFHLGGITPCLDRASVAERVTGRRFLEPGVASVVTTR